MARFHLSPHRKSAYDYPIDDSARDSICNFNAVGGSTILYSGHYPRFRETDFQLRSNEEGETGLFRIKICARFMI